MNQLIMWLDPGKTTGVASYDVKTDHFLAYQGDFDEVSDAIEMAMRLWGGRMAIGWEMYVNVSGSRATASYSYEMIGVAKRYAYVYRVEVLKPMPSSARKLGDDTKLKRVGWWTPGSRHANDAANHTLAYMLRSGLLPTHLADKLFTDTA